MGGVNLIFIQKWTRYKGRKSLAQDRYMKNQIISPNPPTIPHCKRDKMSSTYTVTDYLLDRANIHDTVTKLVRIASIPCRATS